MPQITALLLIVAILYIGDIVSVRTKASVSSVFICAVLFLLGYWTFFPADIISIAGITTPVALMAMYLLITNMGTLLSINDLIVQWKTVVISISGIIGVVVVGYLLGLFLFDLNTAFVAIPPLVGGVVSSLIMSQKAQALGLTELSVFAVLIYVMQGFIGYPLTSIMLKREARKVLARVKAGTLDLGEISSNSESKKQTKDDNRQPRMFRRLLPEAYNTPNFKFFRLVIVAAIAYGVSQLAEPYVNISPFVLCLLFGVIAGSIGFLEKQPLQKANGFGFTVLVLMLFIFNMLSRATPEMLLNLLYPLVMFVVVSVIGMYIFSFIAGKLLGVSKEMAYAISLTSFYGFPADYIITQEVIVHITDDEEERNILTKHMMGPMLVGGFVSVTIVSVILAGIFAGLLTP